MFSKRLIAGRQPYRPAGAPGPQGLLRLLRRGGVADHDDSRTQASTPVPEPHNGRPGLCCRLARAYGLDGFCDLLSLLMTGRSLPTASVTSRSASGRGDESRGQRYIPI